MAWLTVILYNIFKSWNLLLGFWWRCRRDYLVAVPNLYRDTLILLRGFFLGWYFMGGLSENWVGSCESLPPRLLSVVSCLGAFIYLLRGHVFNILIKFFEPLCNFIHLFQFFDHMVSRCIGLLYVHFTVDRFFWWSRLFSDEKLFGAFLSNMIYRVDVTRRDLLYLALDVWGLGGPWRVAVKCKIGFP
jgi:hypothetical protein